MELARGAPGSLWYRAHLRQATVLGAGLTLALLVILVVPLALVLILAASTALTLWIYGLAIVVDVVAFGAAAVLVIGAALRAGRGEIFDIPLVARLTDRFFPKRGV